MTSFQKQLALYAGLAAGNALLATPDPLTWRSLIGVAVAVLLAIKAKMSPDKESSKSNEFTQSSA